MTAIDILRAAQEERWLDSERRLVFHPPRMASPYIIVAGTGETRFPRPTTDDAVSYLPEGSSLRRFNPDLDVLIHMPTTEIAITENAHVLGGRHVRLIGGKLIRSATMTSMIAFELQTGSVFIEGMYLDVAGGECDAMAVRWDQGVADEAGILRTTHAGIIVQHCLMEGIDGVSGGVHGDALQNQTGIDQGIDFIRVENVTFESTYQGIFPLNGTTAGPDEGPAQGLWLRRVNSRDYVAGAEELISYWFHNGDVTARSSNLYPIHLDQVYAGDPQSALWQDSATIPNDAYDWGPTLDTDAEGDFLDFSALGLQITGKVRRGQPPGGDFANAASVGLNYHSPWPV